AAIDVLRIQDEKRFVHLHDHHTGARAREKVASASRVSDEVRVSSRSGSVIIHHFAIKSPFFMSLGACRLKRSILVLMVGLCVCLSFIGCSSTGKKSPPSGLPHRVLASQSVTSTSTFGGLVIIDGNYDILPRIARLGAGSSPGLMAVSPTRNIAAAFDSSSNTVFAVDTTKEAALGNVHLHGHTYSMVIPTSTPFGYAAVPSATINGFSFSGALEVMNFAG